MFCPILDVVFLIGRWKKISLLSYIFFYRPTVQVEVLDIGLASADYRRTVSRLLMTNKALQLGRLSGDHQQTIGRQSADDLFIGRSSAELSAVDRPIISMALLSHAPMILIFSCKLISTFLSSLNVFFLWRKAT